MFLYKRLKSVISSADQKKEKTNNAAFFQILISFYIQSEVLCLCLSLSVLILKTKIKNVRLSQRAPLLQVKVFLLFVLSLQFHEHGAYLVDSLWGVAASELRDWETMTTLLLQEAGNHQNMTVCMMRSLSCSRLQN